MNKLEENKQNFCIDKNKQDIRRLEKRTREHGENIAALNQFKTKTDTDLTEVKSDIEALQSMSSTPSAPTQTTTTNMEERHSYDVYRNRDNVYNNTKWKPSLIFFVCDKGSKFKLHVFFDLVCTYPEGTAASSVTTTLKLDEETIFEQTDEFTGPFTKRIDYEAVFNSTQPYHYLMITTKNTQSPAKLTYYTKGEMINAELWGTNVMFVTRRNDFRVFPTNTQNVMTTTCLDNKARLSTQTADENLSFDISNFRTVRLASYGDELNQIWPFVNYYMTDDGPVYNDAPSIFGRIYPYKGDLHRTQTCLEISESETTVNTIHKTFVNIDHAAIGISNDTTYDPNNLHYICMNVSNLIYNPGPNEYYNQFLHKVDGIMIANINSPMRLGDNSKTTPMVFVVTRENGTSYLFEVERTYNPDPDRLELGFGCNVNAYSTPEGFKIYMCVGKNTKVMLIKKNETTQQYEIVSTEYIEGIQEYWHGANGTHFERVGDTIFYYPKDATTPSASLKLDI